jgi:hypothetical protein
LPMPSVKPSSIQPRHSVGSINSPRYPLISFSGLY